MNARTTILSAMAICTLAGAGQAQEYVRTIPSFNPNGDFNTPWNSLAVGIWATPNNGELRLSPGSYFEPGLINPGKKVKLLATSGPVKIAPYTPTKANLRIASYNTHLFGQDAIPGLPRWNDSARAPYIGMVANAEAADVFLMQEVWDPALFVSIQAMTVLQYPSGFYGGNKEGSSVLDSGLFMISKHPINFPAQVFYSEENGFFESMASKGYIRGTITKDGFNITIFDTHTQSGDSNDDVQTRAEQMIQLANDVDAWRNTHPDHIVIVSGDMNASDATGEYSVTMQTMFGMKDALADGAINMPLQGDPHHCTTCYSNDLRRYFNPDNTGNYRIDYIMYGNSLNGVSRVLPKAYAVRDYEIPAGHNTLCGDDICTRDLSDHYGIVLDMELQRP